MRLDMSKTGFYFLILACAVPLHLIWCYTFGLSGRHKSLWNLCVGINKSLFAHQTAILSIEVVWLIQVVV